MKLPLKFLGFGIMLFVSFVVSAQRQAPKERQGKATIRSCSSISDVSRKKLCFEETKRRAAWLLALNDLRTTGGGATHGGASDCASTAENECSSHLDTVDSLEWDSKSEICVWTCRAIAPAP